MHLRSLRFAALSLGITLLGCKDKPDAEGAKVRPDVPPPAPSATAVVTAAPSASAVEQAPAPARPAGPKFAVRYKDKHDAHYAWVGNGIVVCSSRLCLGDAFMVTEKGVVDTYDPTEAIKLRHPDALKLDGPVWGYSYGGDYPEICTTVIYYGDRDNSPGVTLKRSGKTWVDGHCSSGASNLPDYEDEIHMPPLPREFDDALLHAPIANAAKTMIRGAGAPPMLFDEKALYVWDGKTWGKHDAPWSKAHRTVKTDVVTHSTQTVRLANGSTFVPRGGYLIDPSGTITAIQLVPGDKPIPSDVEIVGIIWNSKFPWIIGANADEIFLSTPEASEKMQFVRAPLAARALLAPKPSAAPPPAPTPPPSTAANPAPSGSTHTPELIPTAWDDFNAATRPAPSSTAAPKPVELPAFTAECKTPFVLLASPPKPGQAYATTRESLKGHGEFQDLVTFVEIVIDEKTLFGVQAKTEADARSFMELVEKNVKGMKPALKCFDVVSQIPDRYNPPEGKRIVGINLTTGELVPFD